MQYATPQITQMTAHHFTTWWQYLYRTRRVPLAYFRIGNYFPLMNLAAAFWFVGRRRCFHTCVCPIEKDYDTAQHILVMSSPWISLSVSVFTILTLSSSTLFSISSSQCRHYFIRPRLHVHHPLGNVVTHMYLGLNALLRIRTSAKGNDSHHHHRYHQYTCLTLSSFYIFKWVLKVRAIATIPGTNHFIDMAVQNLHQQKRIAPSAPRHLQIGATS